MDSPLKDLKNWEKNFWDNFHQGNIEVFHDYSAKFNGLHDRLNNIADEYCKISDLLAKSDNKNNDEILTSLKKLNIDFMSIQNEIIKDLLYIRKHYFFAYKKN